MLHVGTPRSLHWVEVTVDDAVEIFRDGLSDLVEFRVVEGLRFLVHVLGESNRSQVAHRCLILVGILYDFGAQVGTLDHTQVLLVRLGVACILIEHVRRTSFRLRLENSLPNIRCRDSGVGETLLLVFGVESFKLLTITILETWCLVGAKERPVTTLLNPLHEEIRDPHSGEKVTTTRFFITLVETQFEKFHDVRMPWLDIDRNRSLASSSLVHVTCSGVENPKHGDDTVRLTICTPNSRLIPANVMDMHTDTTRPFTDLGTFRQSLINPVD